MRFFRTLKNTKIRESLGQGAHIYQKLYVCTNLKNFEAESYFVNQNNKNFVQSRRIWGKIGKLPIS